ncbi:hypothetical protein RUM44_002415 [Polyplax serrata]|uniref:Uncharacterized protein n=1 Tax=Polyplax serrata TaxID=468196 RepID=A0ABR1AG22_POLSC
MAERCASVRESKRRKHCTEKVPWCFHQPAEMAIRVLSDVTRRYPKVHRDPRASKSPVKGVEVKVSAFHFHLAKVQTGVGERKKFPVGHIPPVTAQDYHCESVLSWDLNCTLTPTIYQQYCFAFFYGFSST